MRCSQGKNWTKRAFALESIRRAQLRFRSASSPLCTFTLGSKIPRQVFRHQSRAFALCKNRNRTQEECKHSSWVLFLFLRTAHCHHESYNFPEIGRASCRERVRMVVSLGATI